jgi:peptide/nickel transport system substrate-binding protein
VHAFIVPHIALPATPAPAAVLLHFSELHRAPPSASQTMNARPQTAPACFARTLLLCAVLAAAACTPPEERRPADLLVIGQGAEPKSLDAHVATSLNDFRILVNLYEGLVRFRDGTLEPEPALARRWEISDDGLRYTFYLRRDVRFHDGTPFDAAAVRFNFQRMLDVDHPYHDTGPFPLAFFFDRITAVEVLDRYTVAFELAEPFAPLLSHLAYPTGLIVSPAAVRRLSAGYGRQPAGTGPFRFVDWQPNRRVMLERNPDYWGTPARSRVLLFRPLTDSMTRVAELMAGGIDIATELSPDNVALLRSDPRFRVHEQSGPHLWFLILNTRAAPFDDRRARQAVNYAVNKRALVRQVLRDTATVADGPVPQAFGWAHDPQLEPYPHDPEKARALLAAAGYGDGMTLRLLAPTSGSGMLAPVQMATAIQADLAAVGLDVEIETYEWNTFLARVNKGLAGQAEMAEMAWMTNDPDTLPYLALRSGALPEHGGFNSGYYENPRVDALIEQARAATAREERAHLYRELQRLVHTEAPWLFVANWRQNATATRRLRGFTLQPSFFLLLHDAWKASAS